MDRNPRAAFTLIELLVVITIIVVLLALLTPALDKAIYQAELAACAAQLKGVGQGVTTYATENRRNYPDRPTIRLKTSLARPNKIYDDVLSATPADDRPPLAGYFDLDMLVDPLNGGIDLHPQETQDSNRIFSNYALWFGVSYPSPRGGGGLMQMGGRIKWDELQSTALVSDWDAVLIGTGLHASHPDAAGVMSHEAYQAGGDPLVPMTISRWVTMGGIVERGPLDTNYAFTDGAVQRFNDVPWNAGDDPDSPMDKVPINSGSANDAQGAHLPRR